MKGYKTILFGVFVAVAPALLVYLGGVDWTSIGISPAMAGAIGLAIGAARYVTTTAIGKAS